MFHARDQYTHPESLEIRSDKSARFPRLHAIAKLVRTLLPLIQLVVISCFGEPHLLTRDWGARDTPDSPALSLCGLFPVRVTPDVPSEPSGDLIPAIVEAAAHIICTPFF